MLCYVPLAIDASPVVYFTAMTLETAFILGVVGLMGVGIVVSAYRHDDTDQLMGGIALALALLYSLLWA